MKDYIGPPPSQMPAGPVPQAIFSQWQYWPLDDDLPDYAELTSSLAVSTHPELEDQPRLEWGVRQCGEAAWREPKAIVDVVFGCGSKLEWKHDADDAELDQIVTQSAASEDTADGFRAFFVDTQASQCSWLSGNFSLRPSTISILRKAGLSDIILAEIFTKECFWAKMGYHCFLRHDDNGLLSRFEIAYRYRSGWDSGVAFTQFVRTRHQRTYLCINYPRRAKKKLETYLKQYPSLAYRDFFVDAVAAHNALKDWQLKIGKQRDSLVYHERRHEDKDINFDVATKQLHLLSRDWHTLHQGCQDFLGRMDFMLAAHQKYIEQLREPRNNWCVDAGSSVAESFEVLKSQCEGYARWTIVYRDRTNIRINLLFHLANQRESRTNIEIASLTAQVAEQTQRDSSSMITIAAVTMLFLPGTFISAILSTTVFDFGSDGVRVSKHWWILPAATLPLMLVVFGVWLGWQYIRDKKRRYGELGKKKVA